MTSPGAVSVIVPTIGRPSSLSQLLASLARQTRPVAEVIVADGSGDDRTGIMASDPRWREAGLKVIHIAVRPPNAVRQRVTAIARSAGAYLLLLDDDVVLDTACVEHLAGVLDSDAGVVAACADFSNHSWPEPTRAWRFYLRHALGLADGAWQGRVLGPLLRFGYSPVPAGLAPMEWVTSGSTLVRRSAYDAAGGFSDFFLHRSTMNEDVDLGLKLARHGRILFCPAAKLGHFHAPGGRVSVAAAAEDDLYNRFLILRRTLARGFGSAFSLVVLFFVVETLSNAWGGLVRRSWPGFLSRTGGRLRALGRVLTVPA